MPHPTTSLARKLRREMTLPEVLIWQRIRANALGVKFRRQHPIGPYVADFYCSALRLVIEIDSASHDMGDRAGRDTARDAYMVEKGLEVLRIPVTDILQDLDMVLNGLAARVADPLHHQPMADGPPPRAGEELQ